MTYASDIYHYIMANKTNKHKIYSEGDRHHRQISKDKVTNCEETEKGTMRILEIYF